MNREPLTDLKPGDLVRIVGQELTWTVLFLEYPVVDVVNFLVVRGDAPTGAKLWNDTHGAQSFDFDVLERIA